MTPNIFQSLLDSLRNELAKDPDLEELNLLSLAQPSVRLVAQRVQENQISLGATRIGGNPDVPNGFEWPCWEPPKDRRKRSRYDKHPDGPAPLGFIAQIDLSAIPHIDGALPRSGWLYFFYDRFCETWGFDPADRGSCRVIYVEAERLNLVRMTPPSDLPPTHSAYPCVVKPVAELTLPDGLPEIRYGTPIYDGYDALRENLSTLGESTRHRLLGYPEPVQGPMELECQLASNGVYCGGATAGNIKRAEELRPGASDWRLLLQIDTDDYGPGWMWGDVGQIYFWIKEQDLSSLRFSDVWLVLQCC